MSNDNDIKFGVSPEMDNQKLAPQSEPQQAQSAAPSLGEAQPQQGYAQQDYQQPTHRRTVGQDRYGINELAAGIFGQGMYLSVDSGSELGYLAKEKLEAQIAKLAGIRSQGVKLETVLFERSQYKKLPFSCLVLCYSSELNKDISTYYTIILSGNADPNVKIEQGANNQPKERLSYPGEALKQCTVEIGRLLSSGSGRRWNPASGIDISNKTFTWDNETQVYRLLVDAFNSCVHQHMLNVADFKDINLSDVSDDTSQLEVYVQRAKGQDHILSTNGRPCRSDIDMILRTKQITNPQTNEVMTPTENICVASGYGELMYAPQMVDSVTPLGQPIKQPYTYRGRFVITKMRNLQVSSVGGMLMNLIPVLSIFQSNTIRQAFYPAATSKPGSIDDIGVLNVEARVDEPAGPFTTDGVGSRVNVFSKDNDPQNLQLIDEYVGKLIAPNNYELALDIEVAGESYHIYSKLIHATAAGDGNQGDASAKRAYREIIEKMSLLTNGEFNKYWKGGVIAELDSIRDGGYYLDKDGKPRDIRDVDTIAVANKFLEQNPLFYKEWSASQIPNSPMTLIDRQATTRSIIENVIAPPTYTSRIFRIVFTADFIGAFVAAMSQMNIRTTTHLPNMPQQDLRVVYQQGNTGLGNNVGGALFNQYSGFNTYQNQGFGNNWNSWGV